MTEKKETSTSHEAKARSRSSEHSPSAPLHSVLRLQRMIGNQGVLRQIQRVEAEELNNPEHQTKFKVAMNFWKQFDKQAAAQQKSKQGNATQPVSQNTDTPTPAQTNATAPPTTGNTSTNSADPYADPALAREEPSTTTNTADGYSDPALARGDVPAIPNTHADAYSEPDLSRREPASQTTPPDPYADPYAVEEEDPLETGGGPASAQTIPQPSDENRMPVKYAHLVHMESVHASESDEGSTIASQLMDSIRTAYIYKAEADPNARMTFEELLRTSLGWSAADVARYTRNFQITMGANNKQETRVKYLKTAEERQPYLITGGNPLTQGSSNQPYDTSGDFSKVSGSGYAIYSMDSNGSIYAGSHKVDLFHHTTFTAGSSVAAAGEWKVEQGALKAITNKSGHYKPGMKQMMQMLQELRSLGTSLAGVELKLITTVTGMKKYDGDAAQFLGEMESDSFDENAFYIKDAEERHKAAANRPVRDNPVTDENREYRFLSALAPSPQNDPRPQIAAIDDIKARAEQRKNSGDNPYDEPSIGEASEEEESEDIDTQVTASMRGSSGTNNNDDPYASNEEIAAIMRGSGSQSSDDSTHASDDEVGTKFKDV